MDKEDLFDINKTTYKYWQQINTPKQSFTLKQFIEAVKKAGGLPKKDFKYGKKTKKS